MRRSKNPKVRKAKFIRLQSMMPYGVLKEDYLMKAMGSPYKIDVIYMDDKLKVPDGTSLKEFVTTNYGEEAANLVNELL